MKFLKIVVVLPLFITVFMSCENHTSAPVTNSVQPVAAKSAIDNTDNRPIEERNFLNRINAESDYEITSNAVQKDLHITAFNKYVIDSLKKITGWEMIVTEINDNQTYATSFSKALFNLNSNPIYNVQLVAPIKIDKSVDTIGIDNRVNFTITIPKNPKSDASKTQLAVIKTLAKGDTVVVSGSLTHLDDKLKVNFAYFYDQSQPWEIDVLPLTIRKKGK